MTLDKYKQHQDWLKKKVMLEQIEEGFAKKDPAPAFKKNWQELEKRTRKGDEVWEYSSPPEI